MRSPCPPRLVQGILGIRHTNEKLEVQPVLPAALQRVSAEVVHLGVRKRVTIDGRNVKVEDLGRVFTPPRELTWRVTAGCPPEAGLDIDRTFETGRGWTATPEIAIRRGQGLALRRVPTSPLAGLWKLDDEPGDTVANGSEYEAPGTRHGNVTLRALDRHGKPAAARFQGGAQIRRRQHRAVHLQARSELHHPSLVSDLIAGKPGHRRAARRLFAGREGGKALRLDHAGRRPVRRSRRSDGRGRWKVASRGRRV